MSELDFVLELLRERDCVPVLVCKSGSNLYGTSSEMSDIDISGVYLPSKERLFLHSTPSTIVIHSDERDVHLHSIYHFNKMLMATEPKAIEMLFVETPDVTMYMHEAWNEFREYRKHCLSKDIFMFMNFVYNQANKYRVKSESLNRLTATLSVLSSIDQDTLFADAFKLLEVDSFVYYYGKDKNNFDLYRMFGLAFHGTARTWYVVAALEKKLASYGSRVKKAADAADQTDWKSLSHAIRVAAELMSLVNDGLLSFPLPLAPTLRDIKYGKLPLSEVLDMLEEYTNKVSALEACSDLSDKPDGVLLNKLTLKLVEQTLGIK